MNEIIGIAAILAVLLMGALVLFFIKFILGRMGKHFLSREESLVVFGVGLMGMGWLFLNELAWIGMGIIFADWILNWDRIVERFRTPREG